MKTKVALIVVVALGLFAFDAKSARADAGLTAVNQLQNGLIYNQYAYLYSFTVGDTSNAYLAWIYSYYAYYYAALAYTYDLEGYYYYSYWFSYQAYLFATAHFVRTGSVFAGVGSVSEYYGCFSSFYAFFGY